MRSARSLIAVLAGLLALGLLAVAPVGAQEGDTLEVDLEALNDSGISGTAILTDEGDAVTVEIEVSGEGVTGGHLVHIHEGTCDNLDPAPLYPLADIDEDGLSETTVEGVTLEELTGAEFAINVHLSAEEAGTYVACGNLAAAGPAPEEEAAAEEEVAEEAAAPAETPAVGGATTTAPATGVGTAFGGSDNGLLVALAALAGVLALAGVALRVREARA